MTEEGISRISKKGKSTNYIKAGTLKSLVNQKISSLSGRRTSEAIRSNDMHRLNLAKERTGVGSHIQTRSTIHAAQVAQGKVQQALLDSVLPAAQETHEKVQELPLDSLTAAAETTHEQVQKATRDSTTAVAETTHEQLVSPVANEQVEEQGPAAQKRKRGRTMMQSVHGRYDRKLIVLNELDQPIGPTKAVVKELASFLGTLARTATLCPLHISDWRKMDTKDDLWNYTMAKYEIPNKAKTWALETIQNAWRRYKNRLKKEHYDAYDNDELRMKNKPEDVSESTFKALLEYWNFEQVQKMSKINAENRKNLKYPHTVGKTSFAVLREEKRKETFEALTPKDFFVATRKRKPGRTYKDFNEDITSKIAEMEKIQSESGDGSQSVDTFASVMGPEHPGHVRLYGRGVTKTALKEKLDHFGSTVTATDETIDKKMEEMEERMRQTMERKMEEQKATIRQEVTVDIITQLKRLNPGLQIDANTLATLCAYSPGEVSSAPQLAMQPIRRPSTDSNTQGVATGQSEDESNDDLN